MIGHEVTIYVTGDVTINGNVNVKTPHSNLPVSAPPKMPFQPDAACPKGTRDLLLEN